MYVGRTLTELHNVDCSQWTLEELTYHHDTMTHFQEYLNDNAKQILQKVNAEINTRGGLPQYGGDYEHPSNVRYD